MPRTNQAKSERLSLSRYLATVRRDRGLSLREAEKGTDRVVSNAYLSQIENGQIKRPSPNVLHALSELYSVSYEDLMLRAGFAVPTRSADVDRGHGLLTTFAGQELTEEEQAELVQYLGFMRSRRKNEEQSGGP